MRHWDRKLRDKMSLSHMWIYWITSLIYNIIKVGVDKITLGRPLVLPLQNSGGVFTLCLCFDQGPHWRKKAHGIGKLSSHYIHLYLIQYGFTFMKGMSLMIKPFNAWLIYFKGTNIFFILQAHAIWKLNSRRIGNPSK